MLKLITNVNVYAPKSLGMSDILIANNVIALVAPHPAPINVEAFPAGTIEVIDGAGKLAFPGLVDTHSHIIGGGGERGPTSRIAEPLLHDFVSNGITTVIGVLGTDNVSRSVETLLVKARALTEEGITAHIFTGSYHLPIVTLTGSVKHDLVCVEQVVGVGEIAIGDHRSSVPSFDELARIASEARVGGMLSGKSGKVHCHLGDQKEAMAPLWDLVHKTAIPITQFVPTHVSRNDNLLNDCIRWLGAGGFIDVTSEDVGACCTALDTIFTVHKKLAETQVTVSSDAFGSCPTFNPEGELVGYDVCKPNTLLQVISVLMLLNRWDPEEILPPFTSTPAQVYKFSTKGQIAAGFDADILLVSVDKQSLLLEKTIAKGKVVYTR